MVPDTDDYERIVGLVKRQDENDEDDDDDEDDEDGDGDYDDDEAKDKKIKLESVKMEVQGKTRALKRNLGSATGNQAPLKKRKTSSEDKFINKITEILCCDLLSEDNPDLVQIKYEGARNICSHFSHNLFPFVTQFVFFHDNYPRSHDSSVLNKIIIIDRSIGISFFVILSSNHESRILIFNCVLC